MMLRRCLRQPARRRCRQQQRQPISCQENIERLCIDMYIVLFVLAVVRRLFHFHRKYAANVGPVFIDTFFSSGFFCVFAFRSLFYNTFIITISFISLWILSLSLVRLSSNGISDRKLLTSKADRWRWPQPRQRQRTQQVDSNRLFSCAINITLWHSCVRGHKGIRSIGEWIWFFLASHFHAMDGL